MTAKLHALTTYKELGECCESVNCWFEGTSPLLEDTQDRPFVRYNAVHSIATGLALIPVTVVTLGLGAVLYLVFFYWAYQAYQGERVVVPVITEFVESRGWLSGG